MTKAIKSRQEKIKALFDYMEGQFPEKSTEWLFQITSDSWNSYHDKKIDFADIAEAIKPESH